MAEEWKSSCVLHSESERMFKWDRGGVGEEKFTPAFPLPRLVIFLSFLADQNAKMLLWVANMKGRRANMSQNRGLFPGCLCATPGFPVSRGLLGLSSCCAVVAEQATSQPASQPTIHPASCHESTRFVLLFVFKHSGAGSLGISFFPSATKSEPNLFPWRESSYGRLWLQEWRKTGSWASFPSTAVVFLKHWGQSAGFNGGPSVVVGPAPPPCYCLLLFPLWRPKRLLCHRLISAGLVGLDKWIRGQQIWGTSLRKDNRDVGGGMGYVRVERTGRAKTLVLLGYKGVKSVSRKACFCQRDKTVINFPAFAVSPPATHTRTQRRAHTESQPTNEMNGRPRCDTSQLLGGGRGDGSCSPTKRRWCDGAARDRMLNCFGVNNLLSAHESWFPYLWEGLSTPALYSPFCLLITTCIIHLYSFKAMNNNNWFITMLLVLNKQISYIYLSNPTEHYC